MKKTYEKPTFTKTIYISIENIADDNWIYKADSDEGVKDWPDAESCFCIRCPGESSACMTEVSCGC